jgi:hypothetical protein
MIVYSLMPMVWAPDTYPEPPGAVVIGSPFFVNGRLELQTTRVEPTTGR